MEPGNNDYDHQQQVQQIDRHQVLPFQTQQLVDSQARESPLEPHDDENHNGDLQENQTGDGRKSMTALNESQPAMWSGIHPPRNSVVATPATIKRFRYSAR